MFWTNFTDKKATIEKARMYGIDDYKRTLIEMELEKAEPGDLVVDPNGEYIYFVEVKNRKIIKASLKGTIAMFT